MAAGMTEKSRSQPTLTTEQWELVRETLSGELERAQRTKKRERLIIQVLKEIFDHRGEA